jgi:RNA polymerase sigma factor (sigma-70 family)
MSVMRGTSERMNTRMPLPLSLEDFTTITIQNQHALHRFLIGLAGNPHTAADLLQDTFQEAWQATQKGVPPFIAGTPPVEVRRWLFQAAYCNAVSTMRRGRAVRIISLDAVDDAAMLTTTDAPFDELIAEGDVLRQALATLSAQDVACLFLRVVQRFSAIEVAHIIGIAPEAVTKRLSRAKIRLRAAYLAQMSPAEEGIHP